MKSNTTYSALQGVAPRWSWHSQELQTLHDRLLHSLSIQVAAVREKSESYGTDLGDNAADAFDHDLALSILSSEQDAIYELEAALRRIAPQVPLHTETQSFPLEAANEALAGLAAASLRALPSWCLKFNAKSISAIG
ncbi:MAG: hypothetical protein U0984_09880 [Prosthecobacter sp.]|nr:hypothetical protein [Prosthecobacter sp.]